MLSQRASKRRDKKARLKRGGRPRRPTMVDVANEARVSQTTVSLVLNHADGARLSAETRERVIKAAAKLGYQPGRRGDAPLSRASTIGFICDDELLFKPTKRGRELFSELVEAAPYPGAKPCFLVPKERWSKRDWLVKVAIATASEIPVPEKTKREKKKRA